MHLNQKVKVVHLLVHLRKTLCMAHLQCTSPTFHSGISGRTLMADWPNSFGSLHAITGKLIHLMQYNKHESCKCQLAKIVDKVR